MPAETGSAPPAPPLLTSLSYNADNNPTGWLWADGKARSISYNSFGQIATYSLGDPAGTGIAAGVQRTLTRDAAGRITGYSHSNNALSVPTLNQSFGYDNLNRLLNATLANTTSQYSYDASGNRTAKVIGANSYNNTIDASSNKLLQTQDTTGTASLQYDATGNVTGDGTNTFTYSDRGRMSSVTNAAGTVNYLCNGLNQRVSKAGPTGMIPTGAAYFVYDEQGQLLGEYDANQNPIYETLYLGATPVGVMKQTGTAAGNNIAVALYNVHADHLATPRVITRQSDNAIVWRWDTAEAFGNSVANQNPGALGAFTFNQRFPGQVWDAETGLLQNWHRDYDARQGRYRQSDPIGLAGGINTYSYVVGNPLSRIDPLGLTTKAEIATAVNMIAKCYPELFPNSSMNVTLVQDLSGLLGNPKQGSTNVFGNHDIQIRANMFGGISSPVDSTMVWNLLQLVAHEMQHVQQGTIERLWQGFADLPHMREDPPTGDLHTQIDRNGDLIANQLLNPYLQALKTGSQNGGQCSCGK